MKFKCLMAVLISQVALASGMHVYPGPPDLALHQVQGAVKKIISCMHLSRITCESHEFDLQGNYVRIDGKEVVRAPVQVQADNAEIHTLQYGNEILVRKIQGGKVLEMVRYRQEKGQERKVLHISYTYNDQGRLAQEVLENPDPGKQGFVVRFLYAPEGHLQQVLAGEHQAITFNAQGLITQETFQRAADSTETILYTHVVDTQGNWIEQHQNAALFQKRSITYHP